MKKIGFLGCGKIGKAMAQHLQKTGVGEILFVADPFFVNDIGLTCPVLREAGAALPGEADLIVECATADVLKASAEQILSRANLLAFSVTAFSDADFAEKAFGWCAAHGTRIYFPHGAILGLDGIFDARELLTSVTIETTKNPRSLGREDVVRTVVYEGPASEACRRYPRNVNVHATVALAGLGFERTRSRIVSDPTVHTNAHVITIEGDGIRFCIDVTSTADGGVTGRYTPVSACGTLDRLLGTGAQPFRFV